MPYTTNQRVRIYYEVEGEGPPVVLHHGLAGSLEAWRDQGYARALVRGARRELGYTDASQPGFKLILIDARGHGRSDKPLQAEAYRVEFMAADVVAVLDALRLPKAHYWGYSLGAAVGFTLAGHARDRIASFILGCYSPYGARTESERKLGEWFAQAMASAREQGMEAYVDALERYSRPVPSGLRARLLANDPRALFTMTKTIYRWQGVGQVLPAIGVPCLFYAGEADPWLASMREGAAQVPRADFLVLRGEDNFSAFYNPNAIIPHVQRFLLAAQNDALGPPRQSTTPGKKAMQG
jgi:pimeloyl-ACP methyl ester carboxylesterase